MLDLIFFQITFELLFCHIAEMNMYFLLHLFVNMMKWSSTELLDLYVSVKKYEYEIKLQFNVHNKQTCMYFKFYGRYLYQQKL